MFDSKLILLGDWLQAAGALQTDMGGNLAYPGVKPTLTQPLASLSGKVEMYTGDIAELVTSLD